jgi:hypothetical protein
MKKLEITSVEGALEVVTSFFSPEQILPKTILFLEELFGGLQKDNQDRLGADPGPHAPTRAPKP